MATKTGVLLPAVVLLVVAVIVVPDLGTKIGDTVEGVVGDLTGGVELVGAGDTQFMVAASAASQVHRCTPQQSLSQEACDNLKFVIFDARRMRSSLATSRPRGRPVSRECSRRTQRQNQATARSSASGASSGSTAGSVMSSRSQAHARVEQARRRWKYRSGRMLAREEPWRPSTVRVASGTGMVSLW